MIFESIFHTLYKPDTSFLFELNNFELPSMLLDEQETNQRVMAVIEKFP